MYKLYIWKTKDNRYYHKLCKGYYKYNHVGDVNQYYHELVHIIDFEKFLTTHPRKRVNYKKMLINDIIRLLEKI